MTTGSNFRREWFKAKEYSGNWSSSIRNIPVDYSYTALRNYLVESRNKTFDKDNLRAFKSLKAYKYFQDGYVQKIRTALVRDDAVSSNPLFLAKSQVMASMSRKVYEVFVSIKASGEVMGGCCECVAGQGEACSHVAALLFALDDFISQGLHTVPEDKTCTDKLKKWNVPAKRHVEYGTIDNIPIYRPELGKTKQRPKKKGDSRHPDDRTVSTVQLKALHEEMKSLVPQSGFSKYGFPQIPSKPKIHVDEQPDTITTSACLFKTLPPSKDDIRAACKTFLNSLSKDEKHMAEIEKLTRGQSNSTAWFQERHCRITASNFHSVVRRRPSTDPTCLLKKLLGYSTGPCLKSMKFGLDQEKNACKKYVAKMRILGYEDIHVRNVGFVMSKDFPFLGASCDGIATDAKRGEVIVEYKNPLSVWSLSIDNAVEKLPCLKFDENRKPVLNSKHAYYSQIQGQMGILGISHCDFVLCTEDDILIQSVSFDNHLWMEMIHKLRSFYMEFMLPELVYPTIKSGGQVLVLD